MMVAHPGGVAGFGAGFTMAVLLSVLMLADPARSLPFSPGDIFVGRTDGKIEHFAAGGASVQVLDTTTGGLIYGLCFDSSWNLYATIQPDAPNSAVGPMAVFDSNGALISPSFGTQPSSLLYIPGGCAISALNEIYVAYRGFQSGITGTFPGGIRRYDASGVLQQEYTVVGSSGVQGVWSVELHCDQCAVYYTDLELAVHRYDVCVDAQLADFVTSTSGAQYSHMRALPNDELLVVNSAGSSNGDVAHFDSGAALLHTFTAFSPSYVAVDLDHSNPGTFWAVSQSGNSLARTDTSSPYPVLQTIPLSAAAYSNPPRSLGVLRPARCGCAEPPPGMAAWWPFDESVPGGPTAFDIAGGHDGTYVSTPTPDAAGVVAGSLRFDGQKDHILVPGHPDLNFSDMTFTVDFWIHPDLGEVRGTIVRKGNLASGSDLALSEPGYHVLYTQSGHFEVYLHGTAFSWTADLSPSLTGHALPGTWTFVAIVFDSDASVVRLYIDGSLTTETTIPSPLGDPSNSSPLIVGGTDDAPSPSRSFDGRLDELELFPYALGPSDVAALYGAGDAGKCKDDVHPPWDKAFCDDVQAVDATVSICNYNHLQVEYELDFAPVPAGSAGYGGACGVDGPAQFDDPGPGPLRYPPDGPPKTIAVPPVSCVDEVVRIGRPAGFVSVNDVACYEAILRNVVTNRIKRVMGSVQLQPAGTCPRIYLEAKVGYSDGAAVLVPGGPPRPVILELVRGRGRPSSGRDDDIFSSSSSSSEPLVVPLIVQPFDADMSGETAPVRVNGGEPGEAHSERVLFAPNETIKTVRLDVSTDPGGNVRGEPFGFYDLVVSAGVPECGGDRGGGDGGTRIVALTSLGLRGPLLSERDLDGDGLSNDYEVAAGLDPYAKNGEGDLAEMYGGALADAMDGVAALVRIVSADADNDPARRSLHPEPPEKAAAKTKHLEKALIRLRGARDEVEKRHLDGAIEEAKSAVEEMDKAVKTGIREAEPYATGMTLWTSRLKDGIAQLAKAGD